MRILVDIDDVIYPTTQRLLDIYNGMTEDTLKYEEMKMWDVVPFMTRMDDPISLLGYKGFFKGVEAYKGTYQALQWLNEKHELLIVTATPPHLGLSDKTDKMLREFPFLNYRQINMFHDKGYIMADMLIDDSSKNIEQFMQYNPSSLGVIIDRPWNVNLRGFNIFRCTDLSDCTTMLERNDCIV